MHWIFRLLGSTGCAAALALSGAARADDADALSLPSAPEPEKKASTEQPLRAFIEVAAGRIGQRYGLPSQDARRASLDLSLSARPAPGWRAVLSDRLDDIHPVDAGSRATLNSLREAYVGWQDDGGQTALEFGRINLRNGPAYGYNPTDFFRDGALRAITTADPLALRENRMGTVMLRGQRVWSGGSVSLALAPKVDDRPSDQSFSADFGATNHSSKALLTLSGQPSDKLNGQLLAYAERGKGLQVGANLTALLSDAAVGFVEWTAGRDKDLLSESRDVAPLTRSRQRAVAGLTYTTSTRLSITGELEFNGFASRSQTWANAGPFGTELLGGYLLNAQRRQESASRQAVLIYATQKGGLAKNLDITGLLRINTDDNSRFTWAEARYHWASVDLALQWQHSGGKLLSEYGVVPTRSVVQVLAAFYF